MKKSVSLILGSGGARGLAHIGVIRELEERDFEIRSVIGCSIGAVIGGCYCAGKLDEYADWVSNLSEWDVVRFLDVSILPKDGVMKGELIFDKLEELIGDRDISDLSIPFTAVATDIVKRREVWLRSGSLFDTIRASMAIPGVLSPKEIDGRTLVDGGLLNPLPGAPATSDATDLTIAVSLSGQEVAEPLGPNPPKAEESRIDSYRKSIDSFLDKLQAKLGLESEQKRDEKRQLGVVDVMLGAFDTMQDAIARYRLAAYPPDVLIEIPTNVCQTHEYYKARPLIAAGRHWAASALDEAFGESGRED